MSVLSICSKIYWRPNFVLRLGGKLKKVDHVDFGRFGLKRGFRILYRVVGLVPSLGICVVLGVWMS